MEISEFAMDFSKFVAALGVGSGALTYLSKLTIERVLARRDSEDQRKLDERLTEQDRAFTKQLDALRAGFTKDVEEHKARLAAATQVEMARLQADLRIEGFRSETQFSHIYQSRSQAIAELYKRLANADVAFRSLMSPLQQYVIPHGADRDAEQEVVRKRTRDQADAAISAYNQLLDCALPTRIYFDESTAERVDAVMLELRLCLDDFVSYGLHPEQQGSGRDVWEIRRRAWGTLTGEITSIKRDLERRFREILGVK